MFFLTFGNIDKSNVYDDTLAEKRKKLDDELNNYLIDLSSFKFDREEVNVYE